jgi:pimeloyl-ACP methyl ester carboxylesterase
MAQAGEAMLWQSYDRLTCPTLLLRGADSDLLAHDTALAMTQRGPRARLHEFAGVGHAPTLVQPEQRAVVRGFLLAP